MEEALIPKKTKKEYMRDYMKVYKQKKYSENPDPIKKENRSRYLAKKNDLNEEDVKKYGIYLYSVVKATELLKDLVKNKPEFIPDVFRKAYEI